MNVGQVCSRHVVSVSPSAPLSQVVRLMQDEHIGAVVVVETAAHSPHVVGIITDRDAMCAQLERTVDLAEINASDAMTVEPLVLLEHSPIDSAIEHLRARGVRRAPVVDTSGSLVGIVSADDLLVSLSVVVAGMAGLVARQTRSEL